jgi:hypothetical protein
MMTRLSFEAFVSVGAIITSVMSLMHRLTWGFSARYVRIDVMMVSLLSFFLPIDIFERDSIASIATEIVLVIWLYITWRDWGRRNRQKTKKLLGEKGKRALAKLVRSMPRSKAPRLAPQPSPA